MSRTHVEKAAPRGPQGRPAQGARPAPRRYHWLWLGVPALLAGLAACGLVAAQRRTAAPLDALPNAAAPADDPSQPKTPFSATVSEPDAPPPAPAAVDGTPPPATMSPTASPAPASRESPFMDCSKLGTRIVFFKNPPDAFRRAKDQKKLIFFIHLSGNFEDDAFT